MIEKRFRYVDATDEVDEHIIDYGTEPHFEYYTLKGATDKLNELHEEKEQLEKENKELKDKLENGLCPLCGARVSKCGGLQKYKGDLE